jgi:hypothetical protein
MIKKKHQKNAKPETEEIMRVLSQLSGDSTPIPSFHVDNICHAKSRAELSRYSSSLNKITLADLF